MSIVWEVVVDRGDAKRSIPAPPTEWEQWPVLCHAHAGEADRPLAQGLVWLEGRWQTMCAEGLWNYRRYRETHAVPATIDGIEVAQP